jgi:uncharacterized SAM-binding protein YcdF (DUF218 family)
VVLFTVLGLLMLALALILLKKSRTGLACLAGGILLLWLATSSLLGSWLLRPLQGPYLPARGPVWGRRNAILVLGGGNLAFQGEVMPTLVGNGRILEAARLYRECRAQGLACKVVVSGGDPGRIGTTEAAAYGERLIALGVAGEDLIRENRSRNTFQNAQFSAPLLKAGGYDQVVLVTSGFHLTRSLLYLSHFGIQAQPVAGDLILPLGSWVPSGYNLAMADMALNEYWGRFQYRFYNWTGRNPRREA